MSDKKEITVTIKQSIDDIHLGLYVVYWKSGGSSLGAIGNDREGRRWIALVNWTSGSTMLSDIYPSIESMSMVLKH